MQPRVAPRGFTLLAEQSPGSTPPSIAQPPPSASQPAASRPTVTPAQLPQRNDAPSVRRIFLSCNPIGPLFGFYSGSLSFAVSERVALRGDVSVFSYSRPEDSERYTEVGLGVPIYLVRAHQGPFLEPGFISRDWMKRGVTFGPQLLAGWHWSLSWGLSASAAIGGGYDVSEEDHEIEDDAFLNGYARIGYAF